MSARFSTPPAGIGARILGWAVAAVLLLVTASCSSLAEDATVAGESLDETLPTDDTSAADVDSTDPTTSTLTEESSTVPAAPADMTMPDLVGLTETEARATLGDLGLGEPTVLIEESFDPAGTVLNQVPSAGTTVTGSISLVVATAIAPMPDFVGAKIAEVRSWADERGIEVRTDTELTEDAAAGEVIRQLPPPGAQPSGEIEVVIADSPVRIDLVDLGALDSYFADTGDIEMDGTVYPNTHYLRVSGSRIPWFTYNLSRDWTTLKLDLGVSDEHAFNTLVQVEIKADGELIRSETIGFGTLQPIELDVTDVLRLSISASRVDGGDTWVGLGNARLIGGAASGG